MANQVPLTLSAAAERTPESLRINYTIANGSDRAAFVSVRSTLRKAASRRPYSLLRGQLLVLTMETAPLPPYTEVVVPFLPFYQKIDPGARHDDFAEIEVPIRELHCYCNPEYPADPILLTVQEVLFVLEAVFDGQTNFAIPDVKQPHWFKARGNPMHQLEAQLRLDAPVPVLKRTDNFNRW